MLKEYFMKFHPNELREILENTDESKLYTIHVDFIVLFNADPDKANKILRMPRQCLPVCDESMIEAQECLNDDLTTEERLDETLLQKNPLRRVKKNVRTRICGVPETVEQSEIGELVSMAGFVVRISQPSVSIIAKHLLCKKCQHVNVIKLEWEKGKFPDIRDCEACKRKSLHPESSLQKQDCADYQEIKIQDKSPTISSTMTSAWPVVLLDDLVDKCTSGDHVNICGFLVRKWDKVTEGQRPLSTTFLLASSIVVRRKIFGESNYCREDVANLFRNFWSKYKGDSALEGRDHILASMCPQLYGMYSLKLALGVILCGGVKKYAQSGTRVRGDSHLLLCGDPGTGKSQILKTAARLAARSIMTTGVGTTSAGLTAAAIKDSDGWHLEAGALVSANGGVCCIDELTTMSNNDMASIHEAMEQQTISVAKAGLVSTLNSRCTVIAAINPVGGRFVDGEEVRMRLGGPLLSRFDVILFIRDNHNQQWDELVSSHILQAAIINNNYESQLSLKNLASFAISDGDKKVPTIDLCAEDDKKTNTVDIYDEDEKLPPTIPVTNENINKTPGNNLSATEKDSRDINSAGDVTVINTEGIWNEKTLREYIAFVHSFRPIMTKEAEKVLRAAYTFHRSRPERREERTTVRLMDSLVRLAEGHAKLMFREEVLLIDAIFATQLINLTNEVGQDCCRFPENPLKTYKSEGEELLSKFDLDNLIEFL